ncbi:hypothetical protein D9615_003587 [Tricholomella constricta]|uniref:Uncharacterized protein n=1 Tax=Tricholomella constricta TaxID=117010 RepID=A0A8H5M7L4_9AGAR|nr:hypothetical protein D9615_003587 [Tricholomella constricta]
MIPPQLALAQILTKHDDLRHTGFIIHLDRSSCQLKRRAFYRSLTINTTLSFTIAFLLIVTALRFRDYPLSLSIWSALIIVQDLAVVFASYSLFVTTTLPFFLHELPFRLRTTTRTIEVVIRRATHSKAPSKKDPLDHHQSFLKDSLEHPYTSTWRFLMSHQHCVSVFPAMRAIHRAIDAGELTLEHGAFEPALWRQENGTWSVHKLHMPENLDIA